MKWVFLFITALFVYLFGFCYLVLAQQDFSPGVPSATTATGWTDDGAAVRLSTTADSVGIGTTTPDEKFEVIGNIEIGDGAAGTDFVIKFDGETNDGSITFMEDEDRIDFDNDVDIVADLTAGTILSDGDIFIDGDDLWITDASGADSTRIRDDGTNTIFSFDNSPIFDAYSTGDFVADEYDLRVGSNDSASVMRIGGLEFGTSDDRTIAPNFTAGGAVYFAIVEAPDGMAEFVFTTSDGDIREAIPIAAAGYGTYFARSVIMAGPSVMNDSIMMGTYWGFDQLLMDTDSTGADLGVQNNVQIGNNLYIDGTFVPSTETVTCVNDTASLSTTTSSSFIVSDGGADDNTDTVGFGDGVAGQIKYIGYKTNTDDQDTILVTLNLSGGASIVFASIEDGVTLAFDGTNWNIVGSHGVGIP